MRIFVTLVCLSLVIGGAPNAASRGRAAEAFVLEDGWSVGWAPSATPAFAFPDSAEYGTLDQDDAACQEACESEFECSSGLGRAGAAAGGTTVALSVRLFTRGASLTFPGILGALVGGVVACPAVTTLGCMIGCQGTGGNGTDGSSGCTGIDSCVPTMDCGVGEWDDAIPTGTCWLDGEEPREGVCCRPEVQFPY